MNLSGSGKEARYSADRGPVTAKRCRSSSERPLRECCRYFPAFQSLLTKFLRGAVREEEGVRRRPLEPHAVHVQEDILPSRGALHESRPQSIAAVLLDGRQRVHHIPCVA
jgi:hypothetical protein